MGLGEEFSSAENVADVARLLGFSPKGLTGILYGTPDKNKYTEYEIPKADGTTRIISDPIKSLKSLQRNLSLRIQDILEEHETPADKKKRSLNHAFRRGHSIISNAKGHRSRRFVLNLDLDEFFPSLNFGRVRGFFIKDNRFQLSEHVATIVAQISCHHGALPQGAPSSPIISSVVTTPLDVRLAKLAKRNYCHYSRYADDITFSTNRRTFPPEIAYEVPSGGGAWVVGPPLAKEIRNAGFDLNNRKTRMQFRDERQTVTGIVVNEKINVKSEYWRRVKAMSWALFNHGQYYRYEPTRPGVPNSAKIKVTYSFNQTEPLQGMLNHIHTVRRYGNTFDQDERLTQRAPEKLYADFLFFRYFAVPIQPTVVTEGKTDPVYLRAAIKMVSTYWPNLGESSDAGFSFNVKFIQERSLVNKMWHLNYGTGDLQKFISQYKKTLDRFKFQNLAHPIIVVCDNDKGAKEILNVAKKYSDIDIELDSTEMFYPLCKNLYLVKVPEHFEKGGLAYTNIESLFPNWVKDTKINGKPFDPDKKHGDESKYGKWYFAEKVVSPKASDIDFSGFDPLLRRISEAIEHYKA